MKCLLLLILLLFPLTIETKTNNEIEVFYGYDYSISDMKVIIRQSEGLKLKAYKCIGQEVSGDPTAFTIGYGQVIKGNSNTTITKEQAEKMLLDHLMKLKNLISKDSLMENEEKAVILFVYAIGYGNYLKSSLYKKINTSTTISESDFTKWSKVNGKIIPNLVKRHQLEYKIFSTPIRRSKILKI